MKNYIEALGILGFKEYETKVFLALLKGGVMSASAIAKKAKIDRTFVYEILKNFTSKGFCNEIETNRILNYQMIDPRIIADKIKKDLNRIHTEQLGQLEKTFNELAGLYKTEQTEESRSINVELIRGYNKHREVKFIELFKQAKKEILFMIKLEGFVSEEIDEIAKRFFKQGGKIKSIYHVSYNFRILKNNVWSPVTIEDLIRVCKAYEKQGEEVRLSESALPNITIFDRETVFTNIKDKSIPRHNESDVIIKNREYANHIADLFSNYWNKSFTIEEYKTKHKLQE
jgi:sugar-specific transcriptional regulator TrmB